VEGGRGEVRPGTRILDIKAMWLEMLKDVSGKGRLAAQPSAARKNYMMRFDP
jgi:hypothetical protein